MGDSTSELLPNLPNDITVQLICTRLPWRTFHVLSSVSRAWLGAVRSGEISDARVRSGTAETLVCFDYECLLDPQPRPLGLALYSLRDKAFCRVPFVSPFESYYCVEWITIGGKVYVLGVMGTEVWVLDVAAQKKWQQCASMQFPRREYQCAVFEGKIYVFGGRYLRKEYDGLLLEQFIDFSEVYDPKLDAWTKISPMKSFWKSDYEAWVGVVRDEILVNGGLVCDRDYFNEYGRDWRSVERFRDGIQAYNPAKDSWRTIPPEFSGEHELLVAGSGTRDSFFTANGRLHSLSRGKISFVDLDENSVNCLHTWSVKTHSKNRHARGFFRPHQVLVTDDGLFVKGRRDGFPVGKCTLTQSTGTIELGFGKKHVLLEEVEYSRKLLSLGSFCGMHPIQL